MSKIDFQRVEMDVYYWTVQFIIEGVYDPGILKAIFIGGGPGSGKTAVAKEVLGVPEKVEWGMSGVKFLSSDPHFERFLKAAGYGTDLRSIPVDYSEFRDKAKRLAAAQYDSYTANRLGIVLDKTGDHPSKITIMKKQLEDLGYDTMMIFVNTTLEIAQERNQQRERKMPSALVARIWKKAQNSLVIYKKAFGKRLVIVSNDRDWRKSVAQGGSIGVHKGPIRKGYAPDLKLPREVYQIASRFLSAPIKNPKGREWMARMLRMKNALAKSGVTV